MRGVWPTTSTSILSWLPRPAISPSDQSSVFRTRKGASTSPPTDGCSNRIARQEIPVSMIASRT